MLTLYQFQPSGNCYKARLAASHLQMPLGLHDVDMMNGETRRAEFLSLNPNGRVPALRLEDGRILPESNAILWYLAEGSSLIPQDRWLKAQLLQWMFFEQYSHEPYIATRRFWVAFVPPEKAKAKAHMLGHWLEGGYAALRVMDQHLSDQDWFVAGQFTIADIALYAYTHVAQEGGFDLSEYPAVRAWMDRLANLPGHITIDQRPLPG